MPIAIVTGASSGIGAATARRLAAEGFTVVLSARRADRLAELVTQITDAGGSAVAVPCDVTSDESVAGLAEAVADLAESYGREGGGPDERVSLLVNNAGGALGLDPVEHGSVDDWQWMFEVNVLGTLRVTKALLPLLEASEAGTIVMVSSTAGFIVYEGGGGYSAAKHGMTAMTGTLRLELAGRPVRVVEIDPGMVRTDEFATKRFRGDTERADAVYAGVEMPLTADDVADCIAWTATRPQHVNIDRIVVRPLAQAAQHKVARGPIGRQRPTS
ncbi:oxidoreductase [Asanoa ishikariensis]|uniref:NADP-dependent 3-hydroxy acid dehydrogenase YdfG n=1 Tax=Asanoa ishikariensis TaxID=137265 RepID=A0A1H3QIX9_9ACTN|nr:SDR family oxidoreductase [Asanoa ishikariensis]GIF64961.1 oxidoreductase [Asanoa ishikariensis]SDZ13564.1 NADP-dependent 3-hydroxy acid dehydrogenase YdfG [Asanoa ishikariensis]